MKLVFEEGLRDRSALFLSGLFVPFILNIPVKTELEVNFAFVLIFCTG